MNLSKIVTETDFDTYFHDTAWDEAARTICRRHNISSDIPKRSLSSDHVVFSIGDKYILKIFRPSRQCFAREIKALEFISGNSPFNTPEIVQTGNLEGFEYLLMTQLSGSSLTRAEFLALSKTGQFGLVTKLASDLKQFHELKPDKFDSDWPEFVEERAKSFIERQIALGVNHQIIDSLHGFVEANLKAVPLHRSVFLHGDIHFGNVRVEQLSSGPQISGIFDLADSRVGFHEYDLVAIGVLMLQGERELQREFLMAYGYAESDLNEDLRKRLMMLTMLYETSDLRRYALRLHPEAVHFTLEQLEKAIWSFA